MKTPLTFSHFFKFLIGLSILNFSPSGGSTEVITSTVKQYSEVLDILRTIKKEDPSVKNGEILIVSGWDDVLSDNHLEDKQIRNGHDGIFFLGTKNTLETIAAKSIPFIILTDRGMGLKLGADISKFHLKGKDGKDLLKGRDVYEDFAANMRNLFKGLQFNPLSAGEHTGTDCLEIETGVKEDQMTIKTRNFSRIKFTKVKSGNIYFAGGFGPKEAKGSKLHSTKGLALRQIIRERVESEQTTYKYVIFIDHKANNIRAVSAAFKEKNQMGTAGVKKVYNLFYPLPENQIRSKPPTTFDDFKKWKKELHL